MASYTGQRIRKRDPKRDDIQPSNLKDTNMSAALNMPIADQIKAATQEDSMAKSSKPALVVETSPFEDVPMPEPLRGERGLSEVGKLFNDCPVGKSFRHPNPEAKPAAVQQQCFAYGKKFGKKFVSRQLVESGKTVIRVWRKEDPKKA